MHDGSSPVSRERSSSLQGMDMASLPPRKRPWQDGPGTGDPREHEAPGSDGGEEAQGFCLIRVYLRPILTFVTFLQLVHLRGRTVVTVLLVVEDEEAGVLEDSDQAPGEEDHLPGA